MDFKEGFDPSRNGDWCELLKDLVAMANSGGGVVVFGVRNNGEPSAHDVSAVLGTDPAKFTDKVAAYTGEHFSEFEVVELMRGGHRAAAILIGVASFPLVFTAAGNYDVGGGKQKTAFQNGTLYFRHGAKSEPATATDLRQVIEREVERRRRSWLDGIRKVVSAPADHRVEVLPPGAEVTTDAEALPVRLVADPSASAVRLVDPDVTHPYRQKELLQELNKRLGGQTTVTSYDNLRVRRTYDIDERAREFFYCSNFGSPQYSRAYLEWLLEHFTRNPEFFREAVAGRRV